MKQKIVRSLWICTIALILTSCSKPPGDTYVNQQRDAAKAGNRWAEFNLWESYQKGDHQVDQDPAKAAKWLNQFVKGVYVVRFEAAGTFIPRNPQEYLDNIRKHTPQVSSEKNGVGLGSFFRTKKEGGKLLASFLTDKPEKLQEYIEQNPDLKFISAEPMTSQSFVDYANSPQESL